MFIRGGVSKQLKKKGGNAISMIKIYVRNFENFTEIHCGSTMAETKTDLDAPQAENPSSIHLERLYLHLRPSFLEEEPKPKLRPLKNKNYDSGPAPIRGIILSTRKYTRYSLPFKFGYAFLRIESSSGLSFSSRILVR
jgi:hypothetical protein